MSSWGCSSNPNCPEVQPLNLSELQGLPGFMRGRAPGLLHGPFFKPLNRSIMKMEEVIPGRMETNTGLNMDMHSLMVVIDSFGHQRGWLDSALHLFTRDSLPSHRDSRVKDLEK